VFLDANVLFSAAYTDGSRLRELWSLRDVELVTSAFALEEARRNLVIHAPAAAPALESMCTGVTVAAEAPASLPIPGGIEIPSKDAPILAAVISSGCSCLLTGDMRHFGPLFGRAIGGVMVLTPAQYFARRKTRRAGGGRV
jgi:predicted nucleic acid-binding protein